MLYIRKTPETFVKGQKSKNVFAFLVILTPIVAFNKIFSLLWLTFDSSASASVQVCLTFTDLIQNECYFKVYFLRKINSNEPIFHNGFWNYNGKQCTSPLFNMIHKNTTGVLRISNKSTVPNLVHNLLLCFKRNQHETQLVEVEVLLNSPWPRFLFDRHN